MKLKNAFITLSILGGLYPQTSFCMDAEEHPHDTSSTAPLRNTGIPAETEETQKPSIVIPSDPAIMAIEESNFPNEVMKKSWQDLTSFTAQTLENFSKGTKRGIFYVHSLEDIMGAADCFTKNWNLNHPDDQRHPNSKNFHEVFTNEEFVENYIPYVLAHRPLISGSILALNDKPAYTLSDTFAPVSFIFQVPAECVAALRRDDMHTPVNFLHQDNQQTSLRALQNLTRYLAGKSESIATLDALVRYPNFTASETAFFPVMNEVAILNCAKSKTTDNEYFRPSVVGVLLNPHYGSLKMDYGNAERNNKYIEAAKTYCEKTHLPFLTLDNLESVSQQEAEKTVVQEWFGEQSSINLYTWWRYGQESEDDPENPYVIKDKTFLLSNEQLNGYHVKR